MTTRATTATGIDKQTTLRLPEAVLTEADTLARRLSQPGMRVSRSDVLRSALIRGLEAMRAEATKSKAVAASSRRRR